MTLCLTQDMTGIQSQGTIYRNPHMASPRGRNSLELLSFELFMQNKLVQYT